MTINDIAELAGVSRSTVSRYLNGNGYVSAASRERIEHAIRQSHFVVNQDAKALRQGRSDLMGIILPTLHIEIVNQVVDAIQTHFEDQGYHILISKNRGDSAQRAAAFDTMLGRNVDGLFVMSGSNPPALREQIARFRQPIVCVGSVPTDSACVVHSDRDAFALMTRFALEAGYGGVGLIARQISEPVWDARVAGIGDALQAAGRAPSPEWFVAADDGMSQEEMGYRGAARMLERDALPDVILCDTDKCAVGVLRCLRDRSRRIPDDIAVVSWGNTDIARYFSPSITSVDIDPPALAAAACALMTELLNGDAASPRVRNVAPHLIRRESA